MRLVLAALTGLLLLLPLASADHVNLADLYVATPWGALDSIESPRFDDRRYVYSWDEVVGVEINGEAHTYPLKLMHWHEVVNDVVGGVPIVVSLCPLCGTALVFERTYGGRVLTFGSSGYLLSNNKVLYDRETGSLWPQILGVAINGTYHGTPLKPVNALRLPFQEWITLNPDARTVARPWGPVVCPEPCPVPFGFTSYDQSPYDTVDLYGQSNRTIQEIQHPDLRMHPKTYVVGLRDGGDALAIPLPALEDARAVQADVGGLSVVVAVWKSPSDALTTGSVRAYHRDGRTFTADASTNELVDGAGERYSILTGRGTAGDLRYADFVFGFWFAWHDLYPDTRVYGPSPTASAGSWSPALLAVPIAGALIALVIWRRRKRASH